MDNKFKIGDRFIIEIDSIYESDSFTGPKIMYRVKGFNSLVFDDRGLEKLKRFDEEDILSSISKEISSSKDVRDLVVGDEVYSHPIVTDGKLNAPWVITYKSLVDGKLIYRGITRSGQKIKTDGKYPPILIPTGQHYDDISSYISGDYLI